MLKVFNTLTREKEKFVPLHPPFVGIYVCGPTVYDDPHLGHAKSYVSFDVIVRFLRAEGYDVRYVQNITDVGHLLGDEGEGEDRVLQRARIEKMEPVEIAQKYENRFFQDMDRLNCLRPDISCRATGHIPEMIELVEKLIEKEDAYVVDGNVYFDISRFKDYGKLSGKRVEELMEGARVKLAEDKRNPADFALWKKAAPQHLMQWNSPWGRGFPGWHLECSVMSMKYLGDSIDIHGGGLDNQFPHHECEIAQSESASGKPFAKYWLHNNMVTVDGKKMSKSLGNHIILTELFDKYDPMTVRFFVLQGHYRSPQDFSDQALNSAQKGFERLRRAVGASREFLGKDAEKGNQIVGEKWLSHRKRFFEFMEDDFNTSGAISVLFDMVRDITRSNQNSVARGPDRENDLSSANKLFSLLGENILGLQFEEEKGGELEGDLIDLLIHMRQEFRDKKEYAMADEIRERLNQLGIVFEDGREETKWRKVERE